MTTGPSGIPARALAFRQKSFFDEADLLGARWWHEGLRATLPPDPVDRRDALRKILVAAGVVAGGGLVIGGAKLWLRGSARDDEPEFPVNVERTLEVQRRDGWSMGAESAKLEFPDAVNVDSAGREVSGVPVELPAVLAPGRGELLPWYGSTLFQAPDAVRNSDLRSSIRPVLSLAMERCFDQAGAVLRLFESVGFPADTLLVADLPGPEAVAFAAGLCRAYDPVFLFDNWPHPRGVVPSHLTLGAAVYYLPAFAEAKSGAAAVNGRPPLLVLDRNRLAPYKDEPDRFDNRYLAKVPSAEALRGFGIRHVLYVVPEGAPLQELDDLNDDVVGWKEVGIDLRILSLADLGRAADAPPPPARTEPGVSRNDRHTHYHYGHSPLTHWWFWNHYGWHRPATPFAAEAPRGLVGGHAYDPRPRATEFSSGVPGGPLGVGRKSPKEFGTVRTRRPPASSEPGRRGGTINRVWGSSGS